MSRFVGLAPFLALAFIGTSHAATLQCKLMIGSAVQESCSLDTAKDETCSHDFPNGLTGSCVAATIEYMGNVADIASCLFYNPQKFSFSTAKISDAVSQSGGTLAALAEEPGFVAGGTAVMPASATPWVVATNYVEEKIAPSYAAYCERR